jgi:hypothetical protein
MTANVSKLMHELDIDRDNIDNELKKFGHAVERDAKDIVPRATGNLAAHIVTEKNEPLSVTILADTKPPPYKRPSQRGADYAAIVEKNNKRYMEPALQKNIGSTADIKILNADAYSL